MRTVALCTNSVVVSSIGASLAKIAGVKVVHIDARSHDAASQLCEFRPDVAIVDLTAAQSETLSLLRLCPGLILIGVDRNGDDLLVLSGKPICPPTLDNLVEVMELSGSEARKFDSEGKPKKE